MSVQAHLLNQWLRLTEKPKLARAKDPVRLRKSFETKSRFFFHAPHTTRRTWETLGSGRALKISVAASQAPPVILYFHGGGYVFGSPRTHSAMLAKLVKLTDSVAILPEYPLAPEAPYPAALNRAVDAYHACLDQGIDPATLVLGGDSAGGGLVFALLARLVAEKAPMPAGVFAFSPLVDLRFSGDSFARNARSDVVLPAERAADLAALYLDRHSPDDPGASPLNGDFHGAPPVWLAVADSEILYDDSTRLAARLEGQNGTVALHVAHNLPHVWPIFHNTLPEARATLRALSRWIADRVQDQAKARIGTR